MKFKRVEIQGFKSYLDKIDGTFDFTVKEWIWKNIFLRCHRLLHD